MKTILHGQEHFKDQQFYKNLFLCEQDRFWPEHIFKTVSELQCWQLKRTAQEYNKTMLRSFRLVVVEYVYPKSEMLSTDHPRGVGNLHFFLLSFIGFWCGLQLLWQPLILPKCGLLKICKERMPTSFKEHNQYTEHSTKTFTHSSNMQVTLIESLPTEIEIQRMLIP